MPIDDFEIGKILGKGAYSSVVLVKRHKDSKTYAMKRVKISQLSPKDKQNALNEIRILASLSHINIIGYKEAFFDDITQTLNIVMEYAEDGDLQSKIKSNKKKKLFFSEETIWNILIQILEGINYLHENKIMHRDLKSANIFINKNGIVKIGDLNVSKVTQFGFASTHTGTPYYASPEVWKDNPYDYKCDIWSIGVILYELCTLNVPFRGTNLKTLVKNINSGVYDNISSNYSKDLNLILSLMLVVNPNKRKSAKELLLLDFVKEKNKGVLNNKDMGHAMLMKTIKMPCNLCDINRALPKKRYNDNEKMLENDEYEIMKESIKEGGFGINFKELVCETDESNNNNNNNINNNNNNNINNNNNNINNNNNNINNNNSKINNNNSNINTSTINNNNSNINTSTINNNKEDVFDYFENIKEIINPSKFDKKYVNLLEHLRLMIENISYGNELIDNKNKEDLNEVMNNLKKGNNSLMKLIEKGKVKNEYLMEICLGIIDDTNRTLNRIDNFNMGKKIGKFISYFIENEKFFNNDNKKKMKSKFNNIF